jgi:polysaccharide export outer membrane protein
MSHRTGFLSLAGLCALSLASGCGLLPSAGPSSGALMDSADVSVVDVTPQDSRERSGKEQRARQDAIHDALARLATSPTPVHMTFQAGDTFRLTMFTITPWSGGAAPGQGVASVPNPLDFGNYTVAEDGIVVLPYVGTFLIRGKDLAEAEAAIADRYARLGIMQSPSAKLEVSSAPQGNIIVTGAVGAPSAVPWTPAGVTLAEALTKALGNGSEVLGADNQAVGDRWAVEVTVLRGDDAPVRLPVEAALEHRLALEPADRVLVTKAPAFRIVVLGGGVSKDGVYEYAGTPTLASVLARASGLDLNVANSRAVFVLEQRGNGEKPVLYDFSWNHAAGLIASQDFPLHDGDLVYVDEAPVIPLQKALNILFEAAIPANLAK